MKMGRPKGSKNGIRHFNEFTCIECGNEFYRLPSYPKERAKFCSKNCLSKNNAKKLPYTHFHNMSKIANKDRIGKTLIEIYGTRKANKIITTLRNRAIPIDKDKLIDLYNKHKNITKIVPLLGVSYSAIRARLKKWGCDTNPNKGVSSGTFKKGHNFFGKKEQTSKKIGKKALERWKDKDWVKKWAKGRDAKPNSYEKDLNYFIINNNLPYKYTGDFSFVIDGKCPDFVDIKNKKVIEIFGIYWHSPLLNHKVSYKRTYQGTMEFYKKRGYKCLILWDYQLKNRWVELCTDVIDFTYNTHTLPDVPQSTQYYVQKYNL